MYKPDHRKGAFIWLSVFFQIITMNAQVQVDVLNAVGIYFGKRRIRIAVMEYGDVKGDKFEGYDYLCSFIGIGSDTIRYHMNTEDIRDRRFPYIENIRDCLNRNDMELSIGASKQIIPSRFGAEAILARIKEAVANIRETIRDVVLTVPLNSTRRYRENLIKAAMSQGFNVISILSEPAAIVNEYIHITGSQDYINLLNELYYILTYYMNEDGYECTLIQVNNRQCTIYDSCSGTIANYKEEADILRAINESHIKINEMLNRNISFLHSNGYMNNEGRLKKEKPILYVVGSLPARPEISRYVKKELNEFQPRFSNYPALAIPIGALMQANDMQLSRDCLWEVRRNSQSTALPLSLFKQVRPTLGKQVVDDNSPMPLAFKLNPLIVEASGGKFRVYAGKRENTYVKEGSDDVFIDLEKAFFLTAFEWSSPSKRMSVVFHFCINEYGNIMIQESSDNPDTNNRRKYCSIYSRNLRPDGKLCNVMDDEVRQLQEEYNDTLKTCMFYVLDGKVLRFLRGNQIPTDNPEYQNARNGGYETLNEYFNRLIEGM